MIWIKVLFICLTYLAYCQGLKYEDRGKQVLATVSKAKSSWSAKINDRFKGKDEFVLKTVCGIKPDFKTHFKDTGKHKGVGKGGQKGRGRGNKKGNHTKAKSNSQAKGDRDNNGNRNGPSDKGRGSSKGGGVWLHDWVAAPKHLRVRRQSALPSHYDWRDYTTCESFDQIRYQLCGDCWAVSSAASMSDRYCLYTWKNVYFSAKQVTSCVYGSAGGCDGGYPEDAMNYYQNNGVATGGDPTVSEQPAGCLRYPPSMDNSVRCPTTCDNGQPMDRKRAGDVRTFVSRTVEDIQREIYVYGSVVAIFEVFQDFGYMGTGVYQHVWGPSQGWHAIRIMGWGVENGVKYWLCANQWGTDWGDEGFFKMLRGSNHCGIEGWITAVYPIEAWQ